MKNLSFNNRAKFLTGLLFLSALSSAHAAAELRIIPVDHVYSPKGFDDNDSDAQVVVTGNLPSFCYKTPRAQYKIEDNTIRIQMTALYEEFPDRPCLQVQIPFLEPVKVGTLSEGTYAVKVNEEMPNSIEDSIYIKKATNLSTDDHMYAAVDYVERKDLVSRTINLKGYNQSDCFELDRIEFLSNDKDTLSVKPIMKKNRNFCPLKQVPFDYEWTVPDVLPSPLVLLHVRVMTGSSINALFANVNVGHPIHKRYRRDP